jgi:hypothetical protein
MLDALRTYLSRIDGRPVEEINRDIDDELATHLSLLEGDLMQSGLSPATARAIALSRFGNPQTHKRRCRDLALKERRMKSLIQIAVPTVCCLMLAAVTTSIWFNQRSANEALVGMNARMDRLSSTIDTRTIVAKTDGAGVVYIKGTPLERPGVYNLPASGATLRRMLAAAGVNDKYVGRVEIRANRFENDQGRQVVSGDEFRDPNGKDFPLQQNDLVTVIEGKP